MGIKLVKSSLNSTRHVQSETTPSTVGRMSVYFQLTMEGLEEEDLVFLMLIKEKRCFFNLSQRDHHRFWQTVWESAPTLPSQGKLPPTITATAARGRSTLRQHSHGEPLVLHAVSCKHKLVQSPSTRLLFYYRYTFIYFYFLYHFAGVVVVMMVVFSHSVVHLLLNVKFWSISQCSLPAQ